MENLIPIGQFATASRLSLRTLRLYDENGLLPPARVDPDSGYRYYRVDQLRTATLIGLLRRAGMPLAEIRRSLADPSAARLDEYEAALAHDLAERWRVLAYVRRVLKEEPMFLVQTKQVGEQLYVSRSGRVRAGELDAFIERAISELTEKAVATAAPFSLYHGEVNEEADGPVEVCVPVAEADRRLPPGEVAFTIATDGDCDFPEVLGAYEAVARWAKEHDRELDGPPREIYRAERELEIAWPLRDG